MKLLCSFTISFTVWCNLCVVLLCGETLLYGENAA